MNVRRSAAALAAATAAIAVIGAATPVVAATPSPTPTVAIPDGLYGLSDPTYDGVWRQSYALLAQHAVGVVPADTAVGWLAGQQCADGAFAAFRADTGKPCDAQLMVDTNSTAAAVQALDALGGHDAATAKAVTWLKSIQNKDGGWGYTPGSPSDTNSTSVVIGALSAAGVEPRQVLKDGKSPYDALLALALPCDGGTDAGAFAFQPDKDGKLVANADATASAVLGGLGRTLAGAHTERTTSAPSCEKTTDPERAALNAASYLVRTLAEDHHLISTLPGAENQPDIGNTADAALALATAGHQAEATETLTWLKANSEGWADMSGPAAYAQLILTSLAAGADPRDFGGADLVDRLNKTGPAPKETPAAATASASPATGSPERDDEKTLGATAIAGVGILLLIVAGGVVVVVRARKRQP
ncbi:prenyltransferase/squalene oxidase repeat-containing protein [Streptomyces sp. NPDC018693]|uniref:prenyltransferase/squalene oxidase repeat-containing protein n=1 Tax=unclassified Streptomyces TaxID=2593676 RepID=UPI0037B8329D